MIRLNSKPGQQGFTLVEVIVVAVIVAAMAAVAVPMYLNYVNNSRLNAATNAAGSAASFMGACINGGGTPSLAAGGNIVGGPEIFVTCAGGAGAGTRISVPQDITLHRVANTVAGTNTLGGGQSIFYSF